MKMKYFVILAAFLFLSLFTSCSSTGFLGLATEEAVTTAQAQSAAEVQRLEEKVDQLKKQVTNLEEELEVAKKANAVAQEALEASKAAAEEAKEMTAKLDEVKTLLTKVERKVDKLSVETIEKLIVILQDYVEKSKS